LLTLLTLLTHTQHNHALSQAHMAADSAAAAPPLAPLASPASAPVAAAAAKSSVADATASLEPPPGLSKTERTEWFKINKPQSQAKLKQPRARAAWFRGITLIYFCFLKQTLRR
jgi:hypothetical protein